MGQRITSSQNARKLQEHWGRLKRWFYLKKLQFELRTSERFLAECKKAECFNLANIEEHHAKLLREKIRIARESQSGD